MKVIKWSKLWLQVPIWLATLPAHSACNLFWIPKSQAIATEGVFSILGKGQIKPKAVLVRRRFSQKTNEQICFVCREKQKSKQNKFVCSFFGRIYGASICFRFYLTFRWNEKKLKINLVKTCGSYLLMQIKNQLQIGFHPIAFVHGFGGVNEPDFSLELVLSW